MSDNDKATRWLGIRLTDSVLRKLDKLVAHQASQPEHRGSRVGKSSVVRGLILDAYDKLTKEKGK